jgi:Lhr-like helicases
VIRAATARAPRRHNAGTIPDRGSSACSSSTGAAVGELDEEMVYEARAGRRSCSARRPGASRRSPATGARLAAPGLPGAVPFWKGEGVGRPYELGQKIGAASRELSALKEDKALARLQGEYHLDPRAAKNLADLPARAGDATGAVPSDRTIVVERFRDEIGDWRVCILTPFGARVHAPWAMAIAARCASRSASRRSRSGRTTASRSTSLTRTRRRRPRS